MMWYNMQCNAKQMHYHGKTQYGSKKQPKTQTHNMMMTCPKYDRISTYIVYNCMYIYIYWYTLVSSIRWRTTIYGGKTQLQRNTFI